MLAGGWVGGWRAPFPACILRRSCALLAAVCRLLAHLLLRFPVLFAAQSDCGVLLTTYETMRLQRAELVGVDWGYVVLDEGHKIRWVQVGEAGVCMSGS